MTPLLANSSYAPQLANTAYSATAFEELLKIRYSTELFRMPTFEEVQNNLSFLDTGQSQVPGLIVMKLDANGGNYGPYKHVLVVFNATNAQVSFTDARLRALALQLHPVQRNSNDPISRQSTFNLQEGTAIEPRLTTAVFVAQ